MGARLGRGFQQLEQNRVPLLGIVASLVGHQGRII
jgi:hypothetical protein